MYDTLVWLLDAIKGIQWLEVIKALASVVTAFTAFAALRNWRLQDKAKRESEFLDSLVEAAHAYIAEMTTPITLLQVTKTGMESYAPMWEDGDEGDKALKGVISYIQKNGEQDAKRLREGLAPVQQATIKLRSLAAKGQVFKFNGYAECLGAIDKLTSHFDRIEAFMAIVGMSTWNWENPEVSKLLTDVTSIDPNEMRESVRDNNVAIIKFAREVYARLYC